MEEEFRIESIRKEALSLDPVRLESYIESIDEGFPEELRELESRSLELNVPIIRRPTQRFLRFLMRMKQPKRILEIGSGVGFSALLMAHFAPEALITTIESYPPRIEKCREHFSQYRDGSRITFLPGDAGELIDELDGKFDFIFLDAAKGQYPVMSDRLLGLLSEDGMIVTDNVLQEGSLLESHYIVPRRDRTIHKRMREYLYKLTHTPGISTEILDLGDGMALSVKTRQADGK